MTLIQIDTTDSRDIKALQLAATAADWTPLPDGAYGISSSDYRRTYRVTAESCDCPDNALGNVCKHRRAAKIYEALRSATAPQGRAKAPSGCTCRGHKHTCERFAGVLVTTREGDEPVAAVTAVPATEGEDAFWGRFND